MGPVRCTGGVLFINVFIATANIGTAGYSGVSVDYSSDAYVA